MKFMVAILILFLAACTTPNRTTGITRTQEPARPEWKQGEFLKLTGTIWPSSEQARFYIDTVDGQSAHLKGSALDHLKPGSKVALSGRVECVTGYGSAGADGVLHSQTFYYVHVTDCRIIDEAGWDISIQNAVDSDKPDYSYRE